MKEQRWPGDYQTKDEQFRSSLSEEQGAMRDINASFGNDYLAMGLATKMDEYQRRELEPSASMQLDTVGMQPHSREYLERMSTCMRSERRFEEIAGQMIDYSPGIHFNGMP